MIPIGYNFCFNNNPNITYCIISVYLQMVRCFLSPGGGKINSFIIFDNLLMEKSINNGNRL